MTSTPPRIAELFGLPRTGKTTISRILYKSLRESDFHPYIVKERAAVCPVQDKLDPLFNLWTATSFLKEYTEAWNLEYDVVIADRGLTDAIVWIEALKEHSSSEMITETVRGIFNSSLVQSYLACTYFLDAPINVVLERERRLFQRTRGGRILNKSTLTSYRQAFDKVMDFAFMPSVLCIDTASKSIKETAEKILVDLKIKLSNC
ncbi:MAG: hypothetical protein SRB2_04541 [Desulfobacteraceae bacterium Eth-SRB2]|nr:MAG: hypothetical protein SRB2_04541 [Desulfobacteraceae bacterium Eth-SRB2]